MAGFTAEEMAKSCKKVDVEVYLGLERDKKKVVEDNHGYRSILDINPCPKATVSNQVRRAHSMW